LATIVTGMNAHAQFDLFIRPVTYLKARHKGLEAESHAGYLTRMLRVVLSRKTGRNHIRITNRLHLGDDINIKY